MSKGSGKRSHVDGLLTLYRILDTTSLDVQTVASTYRIPEAVIEDTFERASESGFIKHTGAGLYELTAAGEKEIDDLLVRGGGSLAAITVSN